jgi:response regulator RpfG family c-di-GMP phosphodiesterase
MLKVRKDIPIILYIGYSHPVSPVKEKAAGISEFLMKPVTKKTACGRGTLKASGVRSCLNTFFRARRSFAPIRIGQRF